MSGREGDHTNAELLSGNAIPQNEAERAAALDYQVEQIVTGEDPIPDSPPSWAKDLPNAR